MALDTGTRKVGYVVLSHQNPRQVARLVDVLVRSDPSGRVIVAHDPGGGALDLDGCAAPDRVHVISSAAVRRWGNYGLVSDLLEAISWALDNLDVDWLAVLSGQDYPLRPLRSFGAELAGEGFDAFVRARPIPLRRPPASDSAGLYAHARYYYRWYRLPRWLLGPLRRPRGERLLYGLVRRFSARQPWLFVWLLPRGAGEMLGVRRRTLPFDDRFQCYMGSQWMTMSRAAALEVREFTRRRPDIVELYRRSIIPDESLVLTVVCNSPTLRVCDVNHHYLRMTGPGESHAAVLTCDDLDVLRESGRWFARKFDDRVDGAVLDELDRAVLAPEARR